MKIKVLITAILLTYSSIIFSQSLINYQEGTAIDIQSGTSVFVDKE